MKTDWSTLIKERNGKVSATRLGFLLTLLVVLLNWSWINYNKKVEVSPLPENVVALVVGLAGARVVQRYGEAREKNAEKDTQTPTQ